MTKEYELSFFGSPPVKWKREHDTIEDAEKEARRVLHQVVKDGGNAGQFTGLIHKGTKQVRSVMY